jgi:[protein-PII] uridylyltransferase
MTKAATFLGRDETPRPLAPADAPGVLPDLIAELVAGPLRREQALDLLRGHLGRIQGRMPSRAMSWTGCRPRAGWPHWPMG